MYEFEEIINKVRAKGVKYIITETIPWFFFDRFEGIVSSVVKKIYIKRPLQNIIIIESHNDFDSNGGAFYDYLISNGYNKKYKIVWFLRNKCQDSLPENVEGYRYDRLSLKRVYYYCIAKYIVCGHYILQSVRDGQKSYYTTHGAFGLKAFKGNVILPERISYILTPSDYLKELLANEYCIEYPNNRQIVLGYPSHDILYSGGKGDLCKITDCTYRKMILWMPTFRRSVSGREDGRIEGTLGIPIVNSMTEYESLNEKLKKANVILIIKIHPMQDMSTVKIKSLSNVILLDGKSVKKLEIDNYRLMKDADALISDYSSVAYDYLHLDRPIAYTMDDVDSYKVGLIVPDPKPLMAGHVIYNFNDFQDFINEIIDGKDQYREERRILRDKIWRYHDGNSSERLAQHMGL